MESYSFIDYLVNGVLALIMLGVGMSQTPADFRRIFRFPKAIITGLSFQIIGLPVLAFLIAYFSGLPEEIKVGLIIISVCPGGASSNLIVHLLKGNVALSISMTTVNSFITLFSIPVIVNLALLMFFGFSSEIQLPVLQTVMQIFIITIMPATVGVIIKQKWTKIADYLEKPLKFILPVMLALVFIIKIFGSADEGGSGISIQEIKNIAPFVLMLNIIGMILGYQVAKYVKLGNFSRLTIAVEVGLQNTALAILVAGTLLNNSEMEKPALVYAMFTFFTTVIFGMYVNRKFLWKKWQKNGMKTK